jgi:uncharacterized protein (DUF362 family)
MDTVAVLRASYPSRENISRALDMLEQIDVRSDESIIVKPNACYHRDPRGIVTTDLKLIKGILEWLKERTHRLIVVESDNRSGSADHRAEGLGLISLLRRLDVAFRNLSREEDLHTRSADNTEFHIPKLVTEADCVVNLPKLKTCVGTTVTLSLKNTFGLVSDRSKPSMHKVLDKILLEVNGSIRRQVIIVDGIVGMEGNGPLLGEPVETGVLVAGAQPVSVDATCSRIMGFDPAQIGHIRTCCEAGSGSLDVGEINVLGEKIQAVAKSFAPPSFAPLSVARTLGSAARLYLSK